MKKRTTSYYVLSPDGFAIERDRTHATAELAWRAFKPWKKGYDRQGYYSTYKNGERFEIPLDKLREHCTIQVTVD